MRDEEWLHIAKRLAVGQQGRFRHGREDRLNLTIANESDRYWAWCHRCHTGGTVLKEHVRLLEAAVAPAVSYEIPRDLVHARTPMYEDKIAEFLAGKGMDMKYMPKRMYVSPKDKRLLLDFTEEYGRENLHGRDLTGKSPQKWVTYQGHGHPVGQVAYAQPVVIVEDLFSFLKVQYALRGLHWSVLCALGTNVTHKMIPYIVDASACYWFFDGDKAGDDGASSGIKRTRLFVPSQHRPRPPDGLDPKDMTLRGIRELLHGGT